MPRRSNQRTVHEIHPTHYGTETLGGYVCAQCGKGTRKALEAECPKKIIKHAMITLHPPGIVWTYKWCQPKERDVVWDYESKALLIGEAAAIIDAYRQGIIPRGVLLDCIEDDPRTRTYPEVPSDVVEWFRAIDQKRR